MGDLGSIPGLGRSPGEGNGYPLQYSGLENSVDCVLHGVSESRTQLKDFRSRHPSHAGNSVLLYSGRLASSVYRMMAYVFFPVIPAPRTHDSQMIATEKGSAREE